MIQARDAGYVAEEPAFVSQPRRWRRRVSGSFVRFLGASAAILAAIVSWVIMAEKLQKVNQAYKKPYFITYWVHSFGYSILYIVWLVWLLFPGNQSCNRAGEGVWKGKTKQLVILSAFLALVSFTSAYSWYYSLTRTNIPSNTAIYQSACVWVFILSIFFLHERVTLLKIVAVVVSVLGVVMVAVYSNTSCDKHMTSPTNSTAVNVTGSGHQSLGHIHRGSSGCTERSTPPGYIALFYSVISYAVFEVSYKKWGTSKHDTTAVVTSLRVLGYMGLHTLIWTWPGFFIVHYSGLEPFEWPPYDIFILLLWNTFLDIFFNAGLLICIALSSALFASVGTILVIPGAIVVDWMLQGFLLRTAAVCGVVLIILGFIGFVTAEIVAIKTEEKAHTERHLQSSVGSYQDSRGGGGEGGVWEDGDVGEEGEEREDGDTVTLLRTRKREKRSKMMRTVLKYLF